MSYNSNSDFNEIDILQKLKEFFPFCFSKEKLDWEKLKLFFSSSFEFKQERYGLNWVGKNNTLIQLHSPIEKTLIPIRKESVNFKTTENLFIEGDNLEVLKLLQKSYANKIKMIYIDPPYNNKSDLIYNDDFSETLLEYKKKVGNIDQKEKLLQSNFNSIKENGHYHSPWLSMMYPRLYLARNLLSDTGAIFVSIDDKEFHNLRLIMDEIYGEDNFICTFIWCTKKGAQGMATKNRIVSNHEYILVYAKNAEEFEFLGLPRNPENFSNPDNDPRGLWKRQYLQRFGQGLPKRTIVDPKTGNVFTIETPYTQKKLERWIQENKIIFPENLKRYPARKEFLSEYQSNQQLVTYLGLYPTKSSTEALYRLFDGIKIFKNPKPVELIKYLVSVTVPPYEYVLDFFAGSGTTAQAVMELNKEDGGNRKFILIQLDESIDPKSEPYKAGYKTISDIAKERIRRVSKKIQQELNPKENSIDIGFKSFRISKKKLHYRAKKITF